MSYKVASSTEREFNSAVWLKSLLIACRPSHWIKNAFVLAALVFSGRFRNLSDILRSTQGFVVFSLVASSIYLFNDIIDREQDSRSESSRSRPIAAGHVSVPTAVVAALVLQLTGLYWGFRLSVEFFLLLILYTGNNLLYSLYIKSKVIADVISIAVGLSFESLLVPC